MEQGPGFIWKKTAAEALGTLNSFSLLSAMLVVDFRAMALVGLAARIEHNISGLDRNDQASEA